MRTQQQVVDLVAAEISAMAGNGLLVGPDNELMSVNEDGTGAWTMALVVDGHPVEVRVRPGGVAPQSPVAATNSVAPTTSFVDDDRAREAQAAYDDLWGGAR